MKGGFPDSCRSIHERELLESAYSVEKLQNFLGGKFICDVTISKN